MEEQKTQVQKKSLNQELRELIMDYRDKHPSLSLNALSQRTNVPGTSLRRLMQEGYEVPLSPHQVLAIFSYLIKEKRISKILITAKGAIGEYLRTSFSSFIFEEENEHKIDFDINEIVKDKVSYLIYKMAANQMGVTMGEIFESFGRMGLKKFEELVEKEWIYADTNERFHAKEKNFSIDIMLSKELSHSLLDQFKPEDAGKGLNLYYSLSEGMNEIGIKKIKEIELEAVKKVFEVMNQSEYIGTIPYFALFLSDCLGVTPTQEVLQ